MRGRDKTCKKILIIHASVGGGHKSAACALEAAFVERIETDYPGCEAKLVDLIDLTGGTFKYFYKDGYLNMCQSTLGSFVVAYFFEISNNSAPGWLKEAAFEIFLLSFIEFLYDFRPDVIVHTHFLAPEIIAALRRRKIINIPQVTVITDYDTHAWWAIQPQEHFFVAREEGKLHLEFFGIPEDIITVSGIPIKPVFLDLPSKQECIQDLGLSGRYPIILLVSPGDTVFKLYESLLNMQTQVEIVVITGRQADVRSRLEQYDVPGHLNVRLEGFTRVMHKYMAAADIICTKPGGLTTAESLVCGLAMAVVNPYPGQEMRNTDMLLEAGVGVKVNDDYLLGFKLEKILNEPGKLESMQKAAISLSNPGAVFQIVDKLLSGELDYIQDSESEIKTGIYDQY